MLHTFQKQIRTVESPERNKTGRVNTRSRRWQGPWSGSYLAVLCCCVEAMSGRVTGNACWVTEHWSFWGAYGIGKQGGGRVKLFNFRNVLMGKGPIGKFLGTKDMRGTHREWEVQKVSYPGLFWCFKCLDMHLKVNYIGSYLFFFFFCLSSQ